MSKWKEDALTRALEMEDRQYHFGIGDILHIDGILLLTSEDKGMTSVHNIRGRAKWEDISPDKDVPMVEFDSLDEGLQYCFDTGLFTKADYLALMITPGAIRDLTDD